MNNRTLTDSISDGSTQY